METLIYNSAGFPRLTLNQYAKAFGLSATSVAYQSLVLISHFIA